MVQDWIVYIIISAALVRMVYGVFRFLKPASKKVTVCSGCATCVSTKTLENRYSQ